MVKRSHLEVVGCKAFAPRGFLDRKAFAPGGFWVVKRSHLEVFAS